MRNGNYRKIIDRITVYPFLPYLWGMETCRRQNITSTSCVLTVPMRNGNNTFSWNHIIPSNVLTVPMRNGNHIGQADEVPVWLVFLPYLWGMETLRRRGVWVRTYLVLTVPMRNGNPWWKNRILTRQNSSYRTYEEWKRGNGYKVALNHLGSYRTYEEWKHSGCTSPTIIPFLFLPYLWGMETQFFHSHRLRKLFLPYLWGMETSYHSLKFVIISSFLPYLWGMETSTPTSTNASSIGFLPYLWGMETTPFHIYISLHYSSYRTYEEWKLSGGVIVRFVDIGFLPYLWGMETSTRRKR